MKIRNKSKLDMENGYIVTKKGNVVCPAERIVHMANELETKLQEHRFLKAQPNATPMPNLDGFERESAFSEYGMMVKTPAIDEAVKQSLSFMRELDTVNDVAKANGVIEHYKPLIEFAENDTVIDYCVSCSQPRFDTPVLGNPLEWTKDQILDAIAEICDVDEIGSNVIFYTDEQ